MIDGGIVTRKLLAHALGVSEPTVSKWVDQGMPCIDRGAKGRPAQLDLRECIAWWRENVVLAGAAKPMKLHEREQLVEIETKELKLRQLRASVIDRSAAVLVVRSVMAQMAAILRQGGRRFGHRLVRLEDRAKAEAVYMEIAEELIADLRTPDTWKPIAEAENVAQLELPAA